MDLIGKIYPPSSKQYTFIVVATDYFTKWVETKPLKVATQNEIINFIKEHIIHRFGIPQTIIVDHGIAFNGSLMDKFMKEYGMSLVNSTLYYAQANGQAEITNKAIKFIKQKTIFYDKL